MALFLALFGRRDKGQNVAGKITRMSACFQSFFPSRSWKQDPTNAAPEATCLHTQTIPDILAQHFTCVQSCKSFRSGERSCLIFRSFWFLRKERSLEERRLGLRKWSVSRVGVREHAPCFEPLPSIDLSRGESHVTVRERTVEMKSPQHNYNQERTTPVQYLTKHFVSEERTEKVKNICEKLSR